MKTFEKFFAKEDSDSGATGHSDPFEGKMIGTSADDNPSVSNPCIGAGDLVTC